MSHAARYWCAGCAAELHFGFEEGDDVAEGGGAWGDFVLGEEALQEPVAEGAGMERDDLMGLGAEGDADEGLAEFGGQRSRDGRGSEKSLDLPGACFGERCHRLRNSAGVGHGR